MTSTSAARRLFTDRPRTRPLIDVAVAAAALVGTLTQLSHGGVIPDRPGSPGVNLVGVVLAVCATVPLLAWRRFPLGVFVVTAAATVLQAGLGHGVDLTLGPAIALFLLAASREPRAPWTGRTTATVLALLVAYLGAAALARRGFPAVELLHTGLAWAVAWFAGERTRLRREQLSELHERVLHAERDAQRERQLAVAQERTRIARDLHDSAGHAVSLIAVRAGAARLRHHDDPERSYAALEAIEQLARQTAGEIDQIVGTLREPANGGVETPPGLASLKTLIAQHASAGLEVTLDTTGTPRPLGAAADQAAYRILQEALTNAAHHGAGSAHIGLVFADSAVELDVTNPVRANGTTRHSGGHGLIGMRERATLLGGTLEVVRGNGAFRVYARIPNGGHRA